jgi:hypothetical protein
MNKANPRAAGRCGASLPARVSLLVGLGAAVALCLAAAPQRAGAQQSYSDYYRRSLAQTGGGLGTESSSRYLYDKYFYHNVAVSPWVNLDRPDTASGTGFEAYVVPELARRQAALTTQSAYIQQRKLQGNVGETVYPGAGFVGGTPANAWLKPVPPVKANSSAYYNHWYGGWMNR